MPLLYHQRTGDEDLELALNTAFPTEEERAEHEDVLGTDLEEDKGVIVAFALGSLGGTALIDPDIGEPYYWVGGAPDPERTTIGGGTAAWYDVEPGDYEVTFDVPGLDCEAGDASWPGEEANSVKLRVMADRWSWNNVAFCSGDPRYMQTADEFADATACEEEVPEGLDAACWTCHCEDCLVEMNECRSAEGCLDVIACAQEDSCEGQACYMPDVCQAVIDGVPGGATGDSTMKATAYGDCIRGECADECE